MINSTKRKCLSLLLACSMLGLGACSREADVKPLDESAATAAMADTNSGKDGADGSAKEGSDGSVSENASKETPDANASAKIALASGSTVDKQSLIAEKEDKLFDIKEYGAEDGGDPVKNTEAINNAIKAAGEGGGGTIVVPAGEYKTYTIRLLGGVNIRIDKDGIIRAARCDMYDEDGNLTEKGEGGNYDEPEVNLYAGLQDHGHTYFANSLFYAADQSDICIYGEGLVDGSYIDDEGYVQNTLSGGDPSVPDKRSEPGDKGTWFGNKGIALVRCENVAIDGIKILNGGHFAIIAEGVRNMSVDGITVDTNRDAFDIDCCEDVTVRNSHFNSLTDDAIVMKASYGAGVFMPCHNVLIEDCVVSGYDAGSVINGTYTTDKLVATDQCGPTARVKFGTESTCGCDTVTVKGVRFERSRGFCLEAVDGSSMHDITMTDCTMDNMSSSPIFVRVGDRCRYPVTGLSKEDSMEAADNVRLDNTGWILPNTEDYSLYPVARYAPSYNRDTTVTVDGVSSFDIVNADEPARTNMANVAEVDGKLYLYKYDEKQKLYVPDMDKEIDPSDVVYYANATGAADFASAYNIEVSNLKVTNVDPRYPILLAGLMDSKIKNVVLKDISVEYRGGLSMKEAVEQRQVGTYWVYSQSGSAPTVQKLPWLVNTFFSKSEGLLPRVSYDPKTDKWVDDPYNVPELPSEYPEPSILGILPSYGLYARHIDGLTMENVSFSYKVEDTRPAIVLDDAANATLSNVSAAHADSADSVVLVSNNYKRRTNMEYVKGEPYVSTKCENIELGGLDSTEVTVDSPAPGTPADDGCDFIRLPIPENGYSYGETTEEYKLPLTVHRPYFTYIPEQTGKVGEELSFTVAARNPANGVRLTGEEPEAVIEAPDDGLSYSVKGELPAGAAFDADSHTFTFMPEEAGTYEVTFVLDDGVIPVEKTVAITIEA